MHLVEAVDSAFMTLWDALMMDGENLDALYGEKNLAYYREYSVCSDVEDLSFLVTEKEAALCGVRVFRRLVPETGVSELSCFGLPLLYAEKAQAELNSLVRARRLFRAKIETLLQSQQIGSAIYYKDRLQGGSLSPLSRLLLDKGGEATPSFSQIIDLSLPEETLHKGMTKAYKWAVNWGRKNLVLRVVDQASMSAEHLDQFHRLHVEAAGRETRTPKSWALQLDMVSAGEAFCVFAWMGGVLVSAALFPHSSSHCYYGVSASRRDLFDKPISHGVIWTAIQHAKMRGLRFFEMGEQLFPMAPRHNPSSKELGISFFKRAFGGESWVSLDVNLKLNVSSDSSSLA